MTAASAPQPLATRTRRRRALIGLTPLIDVVFILLVFFMLASSLQPYSSISLGAPAETGGRAMEGEAIVIDIHGNDVALGGERMPLADAVPLVRQRIGGDADARVMLRPAAGTTLQRTVTVLDALRGIEGAEIAFINTGSE